MYTHHTLICMYRLRCRNSILEVVVMHFKLSIPDPSPLLTLSTPTVTDNTESNTTMAPTTTTTCIVATTSDDLYNKDNNISLDAIPAAASSPAEVVDGDDILTSNLPPPISAVSTTIETITSPTSTASSVPTESRKYTQMETSAQGFDVNTSNNNNNNPIQSLYTTPNSNSPLTSRRIPTTTSSSTPSNYPITSTTTKTTPESESLTSYRSSDTGQPILLFKSTQEREGDIITDTTYILDTSDAFNPYRKRAPVPGSVVSHTRVSTSTGMLLVIYTYYIVLAITL